MAQARRCDVTPRRMAQARSRDLTPSRTRWWFAAIVLVAAAVRLAWVLLVPNGQYSDSVWYDGAAANLASKGVYGPEGVPSAWFPPGYPFFLAAIYKLVGHDEFAGKLGNVAIGVAFTIFSYLLAREVAGEAAGLVAAALIAVWPNLIFSTGILDSDLLAACGFVAVMWLALRRTHHIWARNVVLGVLIGWMVLVRPVSLILLLAVALAWWINTRSARTTVRYLLPVVGLVVVMVGAWTVRNYVQFGEVITIATNGGYNFWQTNQPYADGNDTYWPFVPMDDPQYQTMRNGDEFTKNREGYRYAFAFIKAHPEHLITMFPTKLFWLYHTDTSGFYEGALYPPMEGPSPVAARIVDHAPLVESLTFRYYELLMALSVVSVAFLLLGPRPPWLWPLLSLPILLTLFHVFFHAKDRFHMPLDGVVAILAAVSIIELARVSARLLQSIRIEARARRTLSFAASDRNRKVVQRTRRYRPR